jgi:thymidine kinase
MTSPFIREGAIEVFTGPMAGGKSRRMLERISLIENVPDAEVLIVKPSLDDRSEGFYTRFGKLERECLIIPATDPTALYQHVRPQTSAVAIDDAHFFSEKPSEFVEVVRNLAFRDFDMLIAGLDLDFRGIPFEAMKELFPYGTTSIYKGEAVCKHNGCGRVATRTQRLIDGEPAPASGSRIIAGDETGSPVEHVTYVPRCREHHYVPN